MTQKKSPGSNYDFTLNHLFYSRKYNSNRSTKIPWCICSYVTADDQYSYPDICYLTLIRIFCMESVRAAGEYSL